MRKTTLIASAAFLAFSASAFAQSTVIVTDPTVTSSTTVQLPGEVRTYVLQQMPSVVYDGDIVIGEALPSTVEIHRVDGYDGYAYTVVNDRRVIVDPQTHAVMEVLE
ncbi:hypothetical protein QO002_001967 [Pararhizobium capsulatum DSM 1112]|uniref:DUF1236 domain-containing protein n=1 Tax=Pararhizobium capsulatum DSM 1112 TaxID=1121113 RepID=A0ABU0BNK0_9HYPH|nr:DUF1236 domain-containing protein [Pararhizobium capsulatum]MDQ0319829.1 hypothetical protein [Pararhizobium capsulatum DSM 1112]